MARRSIAPPADVDVDADADDGGGRERTSSSWLCRSTVGADYSDDDFDEDEEDQEDQDLEEKRQVHDGEAKSDGEQRWTRSGRGSRNDGGWRKTSVNEAKSLNNKHRRKSSVHEEHAKSRRKSWVFEDATSRRKSWVYQGEAGSRRKSWVHEGERDSRRKSWVYEGETRPTSGGQRRRASVFEGKAHLKQRPASDSELADEHKHAKAVSPATRDGRQSRLPLPRLPAIAGLTNADALHERLPRPVGKTARFPAGDVTISTKARGRLRAKQTRKTMAELLEDDEDIADKYFTCEATPPSRAKGKHRRSGGEYGAPAMAKKLALEVDAASWDSPRGEASDKWRRAFSPSSPSVAALDRKLGADIGGVGTVSGDLDPLELKLRAMQTGRRGSATLSPAELKIIVDVDDWLTKRENGELPGEVFAMGVLLTHALAFTSTAALHCALLTFSAAVQRALGLDAYPLGIVLLVCWVLEGLARCLGGVLGDLARDRVVLLRHAAVVWMAAALLFVAVATTSAASSRPLASALSTASLALAFLLGGSAHGTLLSNAVALGRQSALQAPPSPRPAPPKTPSPRASQTAVNDEEREDSSVTVAVTPLAGNFGSSRTRANSAARRRASRYYSSWFAATTTATSLVQLYFFVFVDMTQSSFAPAWRGVAALGVTVAALLVGLAALLVQSKSHNPRRIGASSSPASPSSAKQLERRRGPPALQWALAVLTLLLFLGAAGAVAVLAGGPHDALVVRMWPFLLIIATWFPAMGVASRLLHTATKTNADDDDVDGTTNSSNNSLQQQQQQQTRDDQGGASPSALALLALGGALACAAFLRGQLYSTVVIQLCQTRLALPGSGASLVARPDAAGGAVGLCSVLVLLVAVHVDARRPGRRGRARHPRQRLSLTAFVPATRMAAATALSLLGLFLASVVELYRRRAPPLDQVAASPHCVKAAVDFGVLWTLPALVVLGAADALFRVSLLEQVDAALVDASLVDAVADHCHPWAGRVQGALALAEALGLAAALALVTALASWLFGPAPSDLTLAFLLLTTALALTFVLLKGIGQRVGRLVMQRPALPPTPGTPAG